ncbi:hypothetical protein NDU88_005507 [Pleurodeles waltl]|uniref:Uncharacterized protein n=1 Tax=Pleurodeles waltl TaxID=8319 RepID=A0AAV7PFR9_PLEWA|nr:hypothetical protein NDU88_005507 [Pleurodeles waltl]
MYIEKTRRGSSKVSVFTEMIRFFMELILKCVVAGRERPNAGLLRSDLSPRIGCDGLLRPDPQNSIACAASATSDLEANGDTDALVGWLQQPRELPRVKGGVSLLPEGEVVSWSRNIPELLATEEWTDREDAEPGVTETAVRTSVTTGQSGVEEPQRRTEDRWPRGDYA